jgi:hypothetical protein
MTGEESKTQLLEGLLKDALKHLSETLERAISLEAKLTVAVSALKYMKGQSCCNDCIECLSCKAKEALAQIEKSK